MILLNCWRFLAVLLVGLQCLKGGTQNLSLEGANSFTQAKKTVGVYLQQLTYCVTQFVEKEPKLASSVILGLLRYWPITNSQKEVMFLSEIEEVLEATNMVEFQKCMVPLFRRIAHCINNSHFQVLLFNILS